MMYYFLSTDDEEEKSPENDTTIVKSVSLRIFNVSQQSVILAESKTNLNDEVNLMLPDSIIDYVSRLVDNGKERHCIKCEYHSSVFFRFVSHVIRHKIWVCRFCFMSFTKVMSFKCHMQTHTAEHGLYCSQCKLSRRYRELITHIVECHDDATLVPCTYEIRQGVLYGYMCHDCGLTKLTKALAEEHQKSSKQCSVMSRVNLSKLIHRTHICPQFKTMMKKLESWRLERRKEREEKRRLESEQQKKENEEKENSEKDVSDKSNDEPVNKKCEELSGGKSELQDKFNDTNGDPEVYDLLQNVLESIEKLEEEDQKGCMSTDKKSGDNSVINGASDTIVSDLVDNLLEKLENLENEVQNQNMLCNTLQENKRLENEVYEPVTNVQGDGVNQKSYSEGSSTPTIDGENGCHLPAGKPNISGENRGWDLNYEVSTEPKDGSQNSADDSSVACLESNNNDVNLLKNASVVSEVNKDGDQCSAAGLRSVEKPGLSQDATDQMKAKVINYLVTDPAVLHNVGININVPIYSFPNVILVVNQTINTQITNKDINVRIIKHVAQDALKHLFVNSMGLPEDFQLKPSNHGDPTSKIGILHQSCPRLLKTSHKVLDINFEPLRSLFNPPRRYNSIQQSSPCYQAVAPQLQASTIVPYRNVPPASVQLPSSSVRCQEVSIIEVSDSDQKSASVPSVAHKNKSPYQSRGKPKLKSITKENSVLKSNDDVVLVPRETNQVQTSNAGAREEPIEMSVESANHVICGDGLSEPGFSADSPIYIDLSSGDADYSVDEDNGEKPADQQELQESLQTVVAPSDNINAHSISFENDVPANVFSVNDEQGNVEEPAWGIPSSKSETTLFSCKNESDEVVIQSENDGKVKHEAEEAVVLLSKSDDGVGLVNRDGGLLHSAGLDSSASALEAIDNINKLEISGKVQIYKDFECIKEVAVNEDKGTEEVVQSSPKSKSSNLINADGKFKIAPSSSSLLKKYRRIQVMSSSSSEDESSTSKSSLPKIYHYRKKKNLKDKPAFRKTSIPLVDKPTTRMRPDLGIKTKYKSVKRMLQERQRTQVADSRSWSSFDNESEPPNSSTLMKPDMGIKKKYKSVNRMLQEAQRTQVADFSSRSSFDNESEPPNSTTLMRPDKDLGIKRKYKSVKRMLQEVQRMQAAESSPRSSLDSESEPSSSRTSSKAESDLPKSRLILPQKDNIRSMCKSPELDEFSDELPLDASSGDSASHQSEITLDHLSSKTRPTAKSFFNADQEAQSKITTFFSQENDQNDRPEQSKYNQPQKRQMPAAVEPTCVPNGIIECPQCKQKQPFTESSLTMHLFEHYNVKPYVCCLCDQQFMDQDSIDVHARHEHKRVFVPYRLTRCPEYINKIVCQVLSSRHQMKEPRGETDYSVEKQSKVSEHALRQGDEPSEETDADYLGKRCSYRCLVCDFESHSKMSMSHHLMRKHIPKWKCAICDIPIAATSERIKHALAMHGGKKFPIVVNLNYDNAKLKDMYDKVLKRTKKKVAKQNQVSSSTLVDSRFQTQQRTSLDSDVVGQKLRGARLGKERKMSAAKDSIS